MINRGFLTEFAKVVLVTPPVDATGAAISSLWVSMSKYKRLTFIVAIGNQNAIDVQAVTVNQATDNAGTGVKAVGFDWKVTSNGVALDQTNDALVRAAVTSDTFNTAAVDNQLYMIDLVQGQLDINNGFEYVQIAVASPGAHACPISILAVLYDPVYGASPGTQPSVIAD